MRPDEKAKELISKVFNEHHVDDRAKMICLSTPKIALFIVDQIELALTEYGKESGELQNMDSEWRFWDNVKIELNKL